MAKEFSQFSGILCDMDGTLRDSTEAFNHTFDAWCRSPQIDPVKVKETSHGVRLVETIFNRYAKSSLHPGHSLTKRDLQEQVDQFEASIIKKGQELKVNGLKGHVALPGVEHIFESIVRHGFDEYFWDYRCPEKLITSESCSRGKPDPEPYLKGAALLNLDATECLCVEDAPAGIASGKVAAYKALAVCTSHPKETIEHTAADWTVDDLRQIAFTYNADTNRLRMSILQSA